MINPDVTKKTMLLRTDQLKVDPAYQRILEARRVKAIAENYDPLKANMPKVALIDGEYWVFDGQHTVRATILHNGGEDLYMDCLVYEGLSRQEAAELFARQNELQKKVGKNSEMKALYAAGNPEIAELKTVVENAGFIFDFSSSTAQDRITCCSAIYKIYKNTEIGEFMDILRMVRNAWGGNPDGLRKEIFGGMYLFYKTYKGEIDLGLASKKFAQYAPIEVISEGKKYNFYSGDTKYAFVLANFYNKNQRVNRLDTDKVTRKKNP